MNAELMALQAQLLRTPRQQKQARATLQGTIAAQEAVVLEKGGQLRAAEEEEGGGGEEGAVSLRDARKASCSPLTHIGN
jgi:hypothetical protein